MWWKSLLSLAIGSLLMAGNAYCQQDRCADTHWADSAITYIQHHYDYTSRGWQDACDSLLAVCPKLDQVWQMKAMPNIKLGNWAQAYAPLRQAVQLNPQEWLPYQAFLKCIFSKDYEGALPELAQCEHMIAGAGVMDHSFDFFRGLCYLCLDSLPQATVFFKKDMVAQEQRRGRNDVHHVTLFYWGICQLKMKQYLGAELTFRRCLEIYPQYPEPNFYLGNVYAQTGKPVLAKAYWVKARQYLAQGYNSGEDQEFYVNYPFAIGVTDIDAALSKLK